MEEREIRDVINKAFDVKKTIAVFTKNGMHKSAKEYQVGADEAVGGWRKIASITDIQYAMYVMDVEST